MTALIRVAFRGSVRDSKKITIQRNENKKRLFAKQAKGSDFTDIQKDGLLALPLPSTKKLSDLITL